MDQPKKKILEPLYVQAEYEIDEKGRRNAKYDGGTTWDIEDKNEVIWLSYDGSVQIGNFNAHAKHGKNFAILREKSTNTQNGL